MKFDLREDASRKQLKNRDIFFINQVTQIIRLKLGWQGFHLDLLDSLVQNLSCAASNLIYLDLVVLIIMSDYYYCFEGLKRFDCRMCDQTVGSWSTSESSHQRIRKLALQGTKLYRHDPCRTTYVIRDTKWGQTGELMSCCPALRYDARSQFAARWSGSTRQK